VGDRVWFHHNKEHIQGSGKKIKVLQYGPFEMLEEVGGNALLSLGFNMFSIAI
jgi:hypothetical protein